MTDVYTTYGMQRVIGLLSSKLDTQEIKEGSFLYKLAEVIQSESTTGLTSVAATLKNLHLETCDSATTQYYGNDLGISKIDIPYMAVLNSDNVAFIETPDGSNFPIFLDGLIVLQKGQKIHSGKLVITANEDFIVDATKSRVYVSCTMTTTENYVLSSTNEIKIDLNNNYLRYVVFKVAQDVTFTYVTETEGMYKNRMILDRKSEGKRTPEFIRSYFESIRGIRDVTISNSGDHNVLYFTTLDMFEYGDETTAEVFRKIIVSELGRLMVWPTTYSVKKRDKAELYMNIRINGSRKSTVDSMKQSVQSIAKLLLAGSTAIDKNKLASMVKTETYDSISVVDLYLVDTITGAKMYTWNNSNDIYVHVNVDNITEV